MTMTIGWFVFWLAGVGAIGFCLGIIFMMLRALRKIPKPVKSSVNNYYQVLLKDHRDNYPDDEEIAY